MALHERAEERAHIETKEFLLSIIGNAPNGIIAFDLEGSITMTNSVSLTYLDKKTSAAEQIGMNIQGFVKHIPALSEVIQDCLLNGRKVFDLPLIGHRKKFLTARGRPILGGMILWIEDITEQKKAEDERIALEAQLRQSQKLESIGTLASGVAHEINNPVMGIMNYAQLILDKLGPEHEASEFAGKISMETKRVTTIVKNLRSFARQDTQVHSPALLSDIVESPLSLIRSVMSHDQITLEVDVPEDLPKIRCRSQQIQQVIMNLLTNACYALNEKYEGFDENKIISIKAQVFEKDGHPWIRTTVHDHGLGIPEDVRTRMFDPFYTTKPLEKGTGLGLSISHGIVKDHHGELVVESKPGEYTRMHLDLPLDYGRERPKTKDTDP